MDKDILIQNIKKCCADKGELPTIASVNAGVGKDFLSDIKRGKIPRLDRIVDMAAYLGVTTSDLVGDNVSNSDAFEPSEKLVVLFEQLNPEGQEKLLDYADDLVSSGKYIKNHPSRVDKEA